MNVTPATPANCIGDTARVSLDKHTPRYYAERTRANVRAELRAGIARNDLRAFASAIVVSQYNERRRAAGLPC